MWGVKCTLYVISRFYGWLLQGFSFKGVQLEINDSAEAASSKSSLRRANNFIAAVENSWKPENVKVPLSVVFHRRFWPLFIVWLTFDCQSPDMTKHHQDHA